MKRPAPLVVALGALAYISAVSERSTMGFATVLATDKFHTNAEQLSILAVAQIAVYAGMQVPVGMLLDRFGPRVLLSIGALSMALGQFQVAYASSLQLAVVGRTFVGFGDAFTFISLLRLINGWYSGKKASMLQQWLGTGGQVGQIFSAIPFVYLLHIDGWQNAFSLWATVSLVIGVLVWILVLDEPGGHHFEKVDFGARMRILRAAVKRPSTRMPFWVHLMTQSPTNVLLLMWGPNFLQKAEGFTPQESSATLTAYVVLIFIFGTVFGQLCAHRPNLRKPTLVTTTTAMTVVWSLLLLNPAVTPFPLIMVWIGITAMNASASMVAFDYTRQLTPKSELGTVNGFVNIGGFSAGFVLMFIIGVVLDVYYQAAGKAAGEQLYSLTGFRFAFVSVILMVALGQVMYRANERKSRLSEEIAK